MARGSLATVARWLTLLGGIIAILSGLIGLLGLAIRMPTMFGYLPGFLFSPIVGIVLGILAIVGSKYVTQLGWALALILVGFVAGGAGGLLVMLGGVLGLIAKYGR